MWISRRKYRDLIGRLDQLEIKVMSRQASLSWDRGRVWPCRMSTGQPLAANEVIAALANKMGLQYEHCEPRLKFKDE